MSSSDVSSSQTTDTTSSPSSTQDTTSTSSTSSSSSSSSSTTSSSSTSLTSNTWSTSPTTPPPTPTQPTSTPRQTPTTLTTPSTSVIQTSSVITSNGQAFTTIISVTTVIAPGTVLTPTLDAPAATGSSNTNIGAIVGGVVGGIGGLALIGFVVFYILKRKAIKDEFDGNFDPAHLEKTPLSTIAEGKHERNGSLTSPPLSPPPPSTMSLGSRTMSPPPPPPGNGAAGIGYGTSGIGNASMHSYPPSHSAGTSSPPPPSEYINGPNGANTGYFNRNPSPRPSLTASSATSPHYGLPGNNTTASPPSESGAASAVGNAFFNAGASSVHSGSQGGRSHTNGGTAARHPKEVEAGYASQPHVFNPDSEYPPNNAGTSTVLQYNPNLPPGASHLAYLQPSASTGSSQYYPMNGPGPQAPYHPAMQMQMQMQGYPQYQQYPHQFYPQHQTYGYPNQFAPGPGPSTSSSPVPPPSSSSPPPGSPHGAAVIVHSDGQRVVMSKGAQRREDQEAEEALPTEIPPTYDSLQLAFAGASTNGVNAQQDGAQGGGEERR